MSRIKEIINYLDKRIRPDPMGYLSSEHEEKIINANPEELGEVLIEIRKELGNDMPNQFDILQFYHYERVKSKLEVEPNIEAYIDYLNKS